MDFKFHDKLIVRTPLKPVETAFSKSDIQKLFSSKDAKEALFLASPDLYEECEKWLAGEITDKEKEKKLLVSLLKYANRMHNRCTPFGLFASCGVVRWGEKSDVIINRNELFRSTRLDMHFSCQLAQKLAAESYIRPHLRFFPNTSIYQVYDKVRYVEYTYQDKRRAYRISAVDYSIYLNQVLDWAREGEMVEVLATKLVELDAEITLEEAEGFIHQLIENQLLVSELEPSVSGPELLTEIIRVLSRVSQKVNEERLTGVVQYLNQIQTWINEIDANQINETEAYKSLSEVLGKIDIPFELNKLFQTDLFSKSSEKNTLDEGLQKDLKKAVRILNRLTRKSPNGNLKRFKEKFYERYENEEMPLALVLDNETGIGYAGNTNHTGGDSPLLKGLRARGRASGKRELEWTRQNSFLFKKLIAASKEGAYSVQLDETELDQFESDDAALPDTLSIMFSYDGEQIVLHSAGGSSAVNLIGRFALGNPGIEEIIDEIHQSEKELNPEALLAEIVHLPEARVGNILMRPSFRDYEIPYLSKSNLNLDKQIDLNDLYVSIKGQRIVLRSKRLNKEVLPRLGNAHNYSFHSLPVYHFLSDLQSDGNKEGLSFYWGSLQSEFTFLPRVTVGNVILSLATWNMDKDDLSFVKNGDPDEIKQAQEKYKLPDLILFCEGDNELLINLKNPESITVFQSVIRKKNRVTLKEYLAPSKNAIVKDSENNPLANQFVVPLIRTVKKEDHPVSFKADHQAQGNFAPGSEWLYYKFYCGINTSDQILSEVIKPFTDNAIEQGVIDKWFFIRYADPDTHIRVRFHFNDLSRIGQLMEGLNTLLQPYLSNGLIHKVQLDTYNRELDRYGANSIELAETLFFYDSQNIATVLSMLENDEEGNKIRWLFALRAVDQLLKDFDFDPEYCKTLMEEQRNAFGREFGMNKQLNKQIDKKFRADKKLIESILDYNQDRSGEFWPLLESLHQKSLYVKPTINRLIELYNENDLIVDLNGLVGSYIHMLLNRIFNHNPRFHELVIYDFLWKKYRSDCARLKIKMKAKDKVDL